MGYRAEPGAGGGGGAGCWACAHAGTCWAGPETHRSRKSELGTGGWGPALTAQPGPYGDLSRLQQGHGAPGHPGRAQGAQVRLGPLSPWVPARALHASQEEHKSLLRESPGEGAGAQPRGGGAHARLAGSRKRALHPGEPGRTRRPGLPQKPGWHEGPGQPGGHRAGPCAPAGSARFQMGQPGFPRGTPERTPARPPWLRRASGSW